jgi:hypothetical protein
MTAGRLLIVFGDCQAGGAQKALSALPEIAATYQVVVHSPMQSDLEREQWKAEVATADVLFVQENEHTRGYLARVAPAANLPRASFPSLFFGSVWPFDGVLDAFDQVALARRQEGGTQYDFEFQDNLMARLRPLIPDHEERFKAYRKLSAPDIPRLSRYLGGLNFARMLELESHRMLRDDAKHGLGINKFILSNFRNLPLFHTIAHPTGLVLLVMMRECLAKIGIRVNASFDNVVNHLDHYEVPIHPIIARQLGISWADETYRYRFGKWAVTFEEYFRAYIYTYG